MKLYQYTWTEMSGGFDLLVNIEAKTQEIADEIFIKEEGKKRFRDVNTIFNYVHRGCVQDTYTKEYIKKRGGIKEFQRGLPIHYKQKSLKK